MIIELRLWPDQTDRSTTWLADGVLAKDRVARNPIPHSIPFLMTIDETFDVGVDLRTPVNDADYQVPFRFTGKLITLTIKVGPEQLAAADHEIREALARTRD